MIISPELKELLDEKVNRYNQRSFITFDPVSLPHLFDKQEDIEIVAFLAATLSWGRRSTILKNGQQLIGLMEGKPHLFLMNADEDDFSRFLPFVHRTFNGWDAVYFLKALQRIYRINRDMQTLFEGYYREEGEIKGSIMRFREFFFGGGDPGRSARHFSDVSRNSAGKRINMFLRWMVRQDNNGFDIGLWNGVPSSALMIPLDLHSGRVARELGMLKRKQDDWKAVEELTGVLRELDETDPVKYDFALFGLGAYENFASHGK